MFICYQEFVSLAFKISSYVILKWGVFRIVFICTFYSFVPVIMIYKILVFSVLICKYCFSPYPWSLCWPSSNLHFISRLFLLTVLKLHTELTLLIVPQFFLCLVVC